MVDCLQVNSSRWAPSIDRSVKLNTWLCFLADSREIEEQVEPSHPPPSPAIDYRQNPVHSRNEFTCNLLEFPLELATGISTPYNCIAHPNGFHGVYSVEPNARCCHNYPSSEKIIVLSMKKRPSLLCILILDYTITWKRFRGLCVCKNDGMTLITLKKFRMTLTALSRS